MTLLKTKLLKIAKSGVFQDFTPQQLSETREEILSLGTDGLTTVEVYTLLELQFYISLLTNHDVEAKACLDRLVDQFDTEKSQRIKLLQSLYLEAVAGDEKKATDILCRDPDEMNLSRRLTSFSRKRANGSESFINNLIFYLDLNPSDLKSWGELGSQYSKVGNYEKSVYCYKEILLREPFAYNIFYLVGLEYYHWFLQADLNNNNKDKKDKVLEAVELLSQARNHFLRSIEISESYKKGWEGVYAVSNVKEFNDRIGGKWGQVKEVKKFLADGDKLRELSKSKIESI
ncbi:ER membrane protein complex subunit 2 [[Candida] railenensis]|uniref:ER membrane protein complex subunit 2 n=1 Tax=[Candida] railenensis TaxID=45579 RepID=A0A9P0QV61_9ASCO|nr:ER membrane protein complex subunit 2 [[Candida] railenensis]